MVQGKLSHFKTAKNKQHEIVNEEYFSERYYVVLSSSVLKNVLSK